MVGMNMAHEKSSRLAVVIAIVLQRQSGDCASATREKATADSAQQATRVRAALVTAELQPNAIAAGEDVRAKQPTGDRSDDNEPGELERQRGPHDDGLPDPDGRPQAEPVAHKGREVELLVGVPHE